MKPDDLCHLEQLYAAAMQQNHRGGRALDGETLDDIDR